MTGSCMNMSTSQPRLQFVPARPSMTPPSLTDGGTPYTRARATGHGRVRVRKDVHRRGEHMDDYVMTNQPCCIFRIVRT
jgi:hypothetical protein